MIAGIAGKGMYVWKVRDVLGGDPVKLAEALNAAGVERFDVKVAEAYSIFKHWSGGKWVEGTTVDWMKKFRDVFTGTVMGWGFNYGYYPEREGQIAAEQVDRLGLDAYGFDAESHFERQPDAAGRARRMMEAFREKEPDTPAAWVSWAVWKNPHKTSSRYGQLWHYHEVAKAAMEYCDVGAPMVYWPNSGKYWAGFWLETSLAQWAELVTTKPIVPAGRIYTGDGGICDVAGIEEFGKIARECCPGDSWWRMGLGIKNDTWWDTLTNLPKFLEEEAFVVAPLPTWREEITEWARSQGYRGAGPLEEQG